MNIRIANAPASWGVDYAQDPENPPWERVLDEIAAAGYEWLELGPVGYLPEDPEDLGEELRRRGLRVAGTFIFDHLRDPAQRTRVVSVARRACSLIAATGGTTFVVLDHLAPERMAVAGRSELGRRLEGAELEDLLEGIRAVAGVASEHGLRAVLHPHAGTFIEYDDEIDRVLGALPASEIGLCIDTGHSAYAGVDAVALCTRYGTRTEHLHLKDVDGAVLARVHAEGLDFEQAVSAGVFCPLDRGVTDFAALRAALVELGFTGGATVEQDVDPTLDADPLRDARRSLAFLADVGLAEAPVTAPED